MIKKETNNYTKIYDWMHDLNLNATELWIYARLHSLSADGNNDITVTNKWLCERLQLSERQVSRSVNSLEEKGLFEIEFRKHKNGTTRNIIISGFKDIDFEEVEKKPKPKSKKVKSNIKSYGEFKNVKLTDEEYAAVKEDYKALVDRAIEILDDYIESTGKKYKSHRAVLKKNGWVWDRLQEEYKSNKTKITKKTNTLPRATID